MIATILVERLTPRPADQSPADGRVKERHHRDEQQSKADQ